MKVKIDGTFKDAKDQPLMATDKLKLTFRDVAINAVLTPIQGDDQLSKEKKYAVYKLLKDNIKEVDLTIEQLSTLKTAIGKHTSTLVMGQCFELLEGK